MTSIPSQAAHRGVKIDRFQSLERVDEVVRPAIDEVMRTANAGALLDYLKSVRNPPEARRLAGARLLASYYQAVDSRMPRPDIDPVKIKALLAGLDSLEWISPSVIAATWMRNTTTRTRGRLSFRTNWRHISSSKPPDPALLTINAAKFAKCCPECCPERILR